jgi:hypothetical protein
MGLKIKGKTQRFVCCAATFFMGNQVLGSLRIKKIQLISDDPCLSSHSRLLIRKATDKNLGSDTDIFGCCLSQNTASEFVLFSPYDSCPFRQIVQRKKAFESRLQDTPGDEQAKHKRQYVSHDIAFPRIWFGRAHITTG